MFTVIVNLTVEPDRVEEFLEASTPTLWPRLRDEPGCLRFDVHRSTEQTRTASSSTRSTSTAEAFYIAAPAGTALRGVAGGRRRAVSRRVAT